MKLDKGNNATFANIVRGLIKERNTINSDIHALFIRLLLMSCGFYFFFSIIIDKELVIYI